MTKKRKLAFSFTLTEFELDCLKILAALRERSSSQVVGQLIREALETCEPGRFRTLLENHGVDSPQDKADLIVDGL